MSCPANIDLRALTNGDFRDIFDVIQSAHLHVSPSEMRSEVLRSLQKAFRAEGAIFFFGDRRCHCIDSTNVTGTGIDLGYHDSWVRYYSHYDPFQPDSSVRKNVCKVDDILPYRRWVKLKIYNEFYRPQNIHFKLSLYLRSNARVLGRIGLFRPREQQDFSGNDLAKARILVPHLTTALENLIRIQELASKALVAKEYRLTKREVDVVRCVCQGLTNYEIGKKLYISRFTVETHLKNIFDKTGVKHRAGLAGLL
jgi:DNA-binding CsgD family transcriptional regulator